MLKEKIIVLTGGAGLIGKSFAHALAAEGATVILADRDEAAANRTASELSVAGNRGTVQPAVVDITSKGSLASLIESLHGRYGRIDAVINNAYPRNKRYGRPFFEVDYADFCENLGLHLGGYFLTSQQFAAYFKTQGHGNIVNVSSIYGIMAPRFEVYEGTPMTMPVEYAAIKSALVHLTKYMAKYLKGTGIRVNSISPGGIEAGQPKEFLERYNAHGMTKGMLSPGDLSGTLVYMLSDASAFLNGQNIVLDDGFSL